MVSRGVKGKVGVEAPVSTRPSCVEDSDACKLGAAVDDLSLPWTRLVRDVEPSLKGISGGSGVLSPLLRLLKISRGKSATAMPMFPRSVARDEATAETGSHGWPSVMYSFGRYL